MDEPVIRSVEAIRVPPRWIFVRVEDSEGLVGWGEAIVPKRAQAVVGAVRDFANNLMGAPVNRIEELAGRMRRGAFFRGGPVLSTAAAAIDQALWDIKGRRFSAPTYEFFGGRVRESTRTYTWVGGDRPADVAAAAEARAEQGYTAVKMNATPESDYLDSPEKVQQVVERVRSIRERLGYEMDIALDFHGRVHRAVARRLIQQLDEFGLLWIEEPLTPEHDDLMSTIVPAATATPICTGERLPSRWEFRRLLEQGVVTVINPDVSITGLSELIHICRLAEAYDVAVAPHSPQGPLCLAASLQACVASTNVVIVEHSSQIHYNQGYRGLKAADVGDYLVDPTVITPVEGVLSTPMGDGLGVDVDEAKCRAAEHDWTLTDPTWRTEDGRVVEW